MRAMTAVIFSSFRSARYALWRDSPRLTLICTNCAIGAVSGAPPKASPVLLGLFAAGQGGAVWSDICRFSTDICRRREPGSGRRLRAACRNRARELINLWENFPKV